MKAQDAFERTEIGQAIWDVYGSHLSAAEVVRRHPKLTRQWVLEQRKSSLRKKFMSDKLRPLTRKERGE